VPSAFRSFRLKYVASVLNTGMDVEYSDIDIASFADVMMVSEEDQLLLGLPTEELLWKATLNTGRPCTSFLALPTTECLQCHGALYTHNGPSVVVCFGQSGPILASKITLRCQSCHLNYRNVALIGHNYIVISPNIIVKCFMFYTIMKVMFFDRHDQFGDKTGGYRYYDQQRPFL